MVQLGSAHIAPPTITSVVALDATMEAERPVSGEAGMTGRHRVEVQSAAPGLLVKPAGQGRQAAALALEEDAAYELAGHGVQGTLEPAACE